MSEKDPFDRWWEWACKDPVADFRTIDADIHNPVMALSTEDRRDREKVNAAVRAWSEAS
jgi:hypothetical protein